MSAEITGNLSDEAYRIREKLLGLSAPALLIGAERLQTEQNGGDAFDTTYDHFMWDYIGNVYTDDAPNTRRLSPDGREYVYDYPESRSFSNEGSLVLVRRALAAGVHDMRRFLVVTADLVSRTVDEWHITAMEHSGSGDGLRTELRLSRRPYSSVLAEAEPDTPGDVLWNVLRDKSIKLATIQEQQRLPKVVLDNHNGGNSFVGEDGLVQPLAPIQALRGQVDYFWEELAPFLRSSRQIGAGALGGSLESPFQRASGL